MDEAMMRALEADGEKLRQLTGEDHGPFCPTCLGEGETSRDVYVIDGWSVSFSTCPDCLGTPMVAKAKEIATPMVLSTDGGKAIFRLNRDGSIETDWKEIEAMAALWSADHPGWGVIIAKCFVEIAERVRAETEARFVAKSS